MKREYLAMDAISLHRYLRRIRARAIRIIPKSRPKIRRAETFSDFEAYVVYYVSQA